MPRKADYTDRPLTIEEREFATKHHGLLNKYMRNMRLNPEEWYDILVIEYLQAVKKYFSRPDLHQYGFRMVLFSRLDARYQNYFKAKHAQKLISDCEISNLDFVVKTIIVESGRLSHG